MSEEKKDSKPMKLKLTRKASGSQSKPVEPQQPQVEPSPTPPPAQADASETAVPKPSLKLKKAGEQEAVKSHPEPTPTTPEPPVEAPKVTQPPESAETTPANETANPFKVKLKPRTPSSEEPDEAPKPIETPKVSEAPETEPPQPKPEPPIDQEPEAPAPEVEQAPAPEKETKWKLAAAPETEKATEPSEAPAPATEVEEPPPVEEPQKKKSAAKQPKKKGDHNFVVSLVMILFLLGVLGGSAYGIWFVLMQPSAPEEPAPVQTKVNEPAQEIEVAPTEATPKGPIATAKEAISKIPTEAVEEVMAKESAKTESVAETPAPVQTPTYKTVNLEELKKQQEQAAAAQTAETPETPVAQTTKKAASIKDPAVMRAVSAYLGGIHIDGVRSGSKPKVMIGGTSYVVGDLIQSETGLTFDGLRDGKLAFKDKNGVVYLKSF